ncbi:hypothetical protein [Cetobacterium sp.]|uniref:hypothetical protein n=1 Tax=Cetobacterium sp. TaxID=2071632 RepID=UPI003F4093C1
MKKVLLSIFLLLGITSFSLELKVVELKMGLLRKNMELMEKINFMRCRLYQCLLNGKMLQLEQNNLLW